MRIVVGLFQQESNTLTTCISRYEDFTIYCGSEMLDHIAVTDYFQQAGCTIIPTIYAHAVPGGPLAKDDFFLLANELINCIPTEDIDGIWLHLHGALEVVDIGSGERAILQMIRKRVGTRIPICVALDFHANNTIEFLQMATCVVGYRTAPHRDIEETQLRAATVLLRCIQEKIEPKLGYIRVPVVVPGDCVVTDAWPLAPIMQKACDLEKEDGMLACTLFNGQPWVDVPHMGPSVVCYHKTDEKQALNAAKTLAELFFAARHDFSFSMEAYEPVEALRKAYASTVRPVFVTDSGDNTTAGAAGDNAFLLKKVLELHMENVVIAGITDKNAYMQCEHAGEHAKLSLSIGGSIEITSTTCVIDAEVLRLTDIEGWYGEQAGRCAIVRTCTVDIVITEHRCAFTRPRIFEKIGLDINAYRFVVVKLGYLYPELEDIAARSILALTKGSSTERLQDMNMRNIIRPVYPLDDNFEPPWRLDQTCTRA